MNVGNLLTINNRIYSWHYVTINLNVEIESNDPYDHHVSHHKRSGILPSWDHFFELTDLHISVTGTGRKFGQCWSTYWCVLRREFSGMIHWLSINNHPSNPQQPIHSLRLAPDTLDFITERESFQWSENIKSLWKKKHNHHDHPKNRL